MPPNRRRRRVPGATPSATPRADDGKSQPGKAELAKSRREGAAKSPEKGQRRPLGKFFWIYFAVMMVVLIPMNLLCTGQAGRGTGEASELQDVIVLDSVDQAHPAYKTTPPTSGALVPITVSPGLHPTTIPEPIQVGSLQRGFVIVHYNCTACPEARDRLARLAKEYEGYDVAFQPNTSLGKDQIALTAWGRIERQEKFDEAGVRKFIEANTGGDYRRLVAPAGTGASPQAAATAASKPAT